MKTAVIAGTPVDTRMGAELLKARGVETESYPVSRTPEEQTAFQAGPEAGREAAVGALLDRIKAEGIGRVLLYCNSLSASVDAHGLAEERGLKLWTPMDVYRELAPKYKRVGVIAANCQGAAGIERAIVNANPAARVLGAGVLSLVLGIEAGADPEALAEECGVPALLRFFEAGGAEAVVLGCTHFPYIREAVRRRTGLPVVDPSERLAEMALEG